MVGVGTRGLVHVGLVLVGVGTSWGWYYILSRIPMLISPRPSVAPAVAALHAALHAAVAAHIRSKGPLGYTSAAFLFREMIKSVFVWCLSGACLLLCAAVEPLYLPNSPPTPQIYPCTL